MVKPVKLGANERMTFSKINEVIDMPNLIEIQKDSYKWFVEEGLKEVFRDMSAITDYSGKAEVYLLDYTLEPEPKITIPEAKRKSSNYSVALKVKVTVPPLEIPVEPLIEVEKSAALTTVKFKVSKNIITNALNIFFILFPPVRPNVFLR